MEKRWEIAEYAYKNCAMYNQLIEKFSGLSWEELPIIEKDTILHSDYIIANDYLVKDYNDELINLFTSGSTGHCLNVKWDKADANRSLSKLWFLRYFKFGVLPHDKYCYFFNSSLANVNNGYINKFDYALGIYSGLLVGEEIANVYMKMIEFSPKWLLIQPSIASLLCFAKEKYGLPEFPNLVYIELVGEMHSLEQASRISKIFNCPTRSQYGTYEVFSIAYECSAHMLHVDTNNVYVEIVSEEGKVLADGEEGDVIVTSLNNYAMPFIRYNTGDKGRMWRKFKCVCGKREAVLQLSSGRSSDMIIMSNGNKLTAYTFFRIFMDVNSFIDNAVYQYQVEQIDINEFIIRIVTDKEINERQIVDCFFRCMNEPLLEEAKFKFEFLDYLPVDSVTGKTKCFLSNIKK